MGTIRVQNVAKQFGGQVVLDGVSVDFHSGEIVALIGPNGAGKTTLFRLITGQLQPDTGTVTLSRGLEVGYLPQEPDFSASATLHDAVAEAFTELLDLEHKLQQLSEQIGHAHDAPELPGLMAQYDRMQARFETAGGYSFEQRLNEVLGGLGFSPADYTLPVTALSGGQRCRAALARLLLQERQFLLLDEPTNHLDIDAVRWLERFLAGYHGGAIVISHDRYLLDRIAQRTVECAGGGVSSFPGNYSNYVQTRAARELTQRRQFEQDQAFIRKERDFIARHLAGQRSQQAKGRRTRLERMLSDGELTVDRPHDTEKLHLAFDAGRAADAVGARRGHEILRVEELSKRYDPKVLFSDLSLELYAGQRLGITGPNGTGKTTLLKILLGQVRADGGSARLAPTARVGYFAQDAEALHPDNSVITEIQSVRPDLLERDARHVAARFLFTGDDPFKRVGSLSGGEQSRLRFMKLILAVPDVLILDEPTNHLDIPSREALEGALAEFPGVIITVSHDRYFLDRIAQQLLVMRPDTARVYPGNYSYYIEQVEQARTADEAARAAAQTAGRQGGHAGGAGQRGGRSGGRSGGAGRSGSAGQAGAGGRSAAKGPRSPLAKLKMSELEAYIADHERRLADLHERFADPSIYRDAGQVTRLRAEFETLQAELTAAEQAWLERAEGG